MRKCTEVAQSGLGRKAHNLEIGGSNPPLCTPNGIYFCAFNGVKIVLKEVEKE